MVERTQESSRDCWPTRREALDLGYTLGYLQATVDIHKMQQSPPKNGDGWLQRNLRRAKVWVEGYELLSKLWAMRRPLGLTVVIASWWEQLLWLLRLIVG